MKNDFTNLNQLDAMVDHPVSTQIDTVFKSVIKEEVQPSSSSESGVSMSVKDQDLEIDEIELDLGGDEPAQDTPLDEGMELSFSDDDGLDLGAPDAGNEDSTSVEQFGDLNLEEEADGPSLDDSPKEIKEEGPVGELSFEDLTPELPDEEALSLDDEASSELGNFTLAGTQASVLNLNDTVGFSSSDEEDLSFHNDEELTLSGNEAELSEDAKEKLKEIDAIMDLDASKVDLTMRNLRLHEDLNEPLVSDDLDLASLDFSSDEILEEPKEEKPKKKKKEIQSTVRDHDYGQDLKEISGAYSGEMDRMQATLSNLRSDRQELLNKIQFLEEEKVMSGRQSLSMRAELDEKKIELTIIRKKLNEEISELKDRLKFFDEKRLILEEKNRILTQELDKNSQRNKMDVKKVQMRERELEQKLELLKSDAESQIRHRDLKILELKRKIDAMEFDMESISMQEKRSVESRFELEDKLEKAIKTLRGAINVLEDESDRTNALNALKKNIDM